MSLGAFHSRCTSSSDTSSALSDLGFSGSFCSGGDDDEVGLAAASLDHPLVPSSLIAATRYTYSVPVSRPPSSYVVSASPVSGSTASNSPPLTSFLSIL